MVYGNLKLSFHTYVFSKAYFCSTGVNAGLKAERLLARKTFLSTDSHVLLRVIFLPAHERGRNPLAFWFVHIQACNLDRWRNTSSV